MCVRFSRRFTKAYEKASPKIQSAFERRLKLFLEDPFNPQLNNHSLHGDFSGYGSINITGDWRAIYSERAESGEKVIILEFLGTHSQLYKT